MLHAKIEHMNKYIIIVSPLEDRSDDDPRFGITISHPSGHPGVGSMMEYQSVPELVGALCKLIPTTRACDRTSVEASIKARVAFVITEVPLKGEDFDRSGISRPK